MSNFSSLRWGIIALLAVACLPRARANDLLSLNSTDGTRWQVFACDGVATAEALAQGALPAGGVEGIVPGTVFAAYVAAGQEADPDYGDNIYRVDETKYNKSFWYRTTFARPTLAAQGRAVLTFEGINRYATVYLNGQRLGTIKGHVLKVRYDITSLLQATNVLAVKIDMPAERTLARDASFVNYVCPTYVASHSWDWMPYVPGLNCGITNDVYIELAGDVTARDPWVRPLLSTDNAQATLQLRTSLQNLASASRHVEVRATIVETGQRVSSSVDIAAADSIDLRLPDIAISQPRLWWPNGSGPQNLYTCRFDVVRDGSVVDSQTTRFGIRRYEYRKENTALTLYVNGQKTYCKGGNWGMSDYLLRCHGNDYDTRIRLHQDMNYNMLRLWTGCVTDEELYDACDRYGIMLWDDFWLTGPYTGLTGPDDRTEFMANARDKVIRLRNHPSIAVWCGCNEGWPYTELNNDIIGVVDTYDGGDRLYMPNSHNGYPTGAANDAKDDTGLGLSGSGWWTNFAPEEYFATGIWGGGGDKGDVTDWGFRTELGMAAFTTFESFREFMPQDAWWPQNEMWEKHFFSDQPAYGGGAIASKYFDTVARNYGAADGIEEFCERAQFTNIETMKAMYEGWQDNLWNTASGLLFWMSQSAYPSFIWQTYDYYLDMTGTYWGAKKACEPLHIQWNCSNNRVNVVNTSGADATGLKATTEVFDLNGRPYAPLTTSTQHIAAPQNQVTHIGTLEATQANLALGRPCTASSNVDDFTAANATDGNTATRWSSIYFGGDDSWIHVDLGSRQTIGSVRLRWEPNGAYGKRYKIQTSDDAQTWTDAYTENDGDGNDDLIRLSQPVTARYVKMQGIERGTIWGYSLTELEVFAPGYDSQFDGMYFIRLRLTDSNDQPISENFYWANTRSKDDYTELNTLPRADIEARILETETTDGTTRMRVEVANGSPTVAFGIRLRLVDAQTGQRILPVVMDDNYFTLMGGESRTIGMEFDASRSVRPRLLVKQYGQAEQTGDEVPDGIEPPATTQAATTTGDTAIYNLQGMRQGSPLGQLPKGIYIQGGRKLMRP